MESESSNTSADKPLPLGDLSRFADVMQVLLKTFLRPLVPLMDWLENTLTAIAKRIKQH